jgi:hypothetical protein
VGAQDGSNAERWSARVEEVEREGLNDDNCNEP